MSENLYRVGQAVRVIGRDTCYMVAAIYRVENWYFYELSGMAGFLSREDKLTDGDT